MTRSREWIEETLDEQLAKGRKLLDGHIRSESDWKVQHASFEKWDAYNKELLHQSFDGGDLVTAYDPPSAAVWIGGRGLRGQIEDLQGEIRDRLGNLEAIRARLDLIPDQAPSLEVPKAALDRVIWILGRFHEVVKQLNRARTAGVSAKMVDEYAVQDLLHGLLKIDFSDVRPEENTPSFGGGASRQDFLLKSEQIVVEAKRTRDGLTDKQVRNELIQDMATYGVHPDCKSLVCFVYDPDGRIQNKAGLIYDLETLSTPRLPVRVIITP